MSDAIHPKASHHLPGFITAPGETDVLMGVTLVLLMAIIVGIGVFYFRLHALPEQIAHKTEKVQFQVVAVLALLALFTHNHIYWIAALLLSLVRLPDFATPLSGMATSLATMASAARRPARPEPPPQADGAGKTVATAHGAGGVSENSTTAPVVAPDDQADTATPARQAEAKSNV